MKFCTTCGAAIEDGTKFCPSCGAAQIDAPAPEAAPAYTPAPESTLAPEFAEIGPDTPKPAKAPKKAKKAKKSPVGAIIAIVAVVAILGAAAALWFTGIIPNLLMKPYQRFTSIHTQITDPMVDALAASVTGNYSDIEGANTKLDTDMTITAEIDDSGLPYYYASIVDIVNDATVTLKVNAEYGKESLIGIESEIMDTDVFGGTIVLGTDYIGVQVPALSDEYYVLKFEDIAELLDEMGVDVDEDLVETYISMASGKTAMTSMKQADVKKLLNKYVEIFFSMVNEKNCVQTKGTVKLNGVGKKVDCTILTFTPTADDITKMVEELVKTASKDKDLAKLAQEVIAYNLTVSGEDADDAEDAAEEAWDQLLESLEDLTDNVDDFADYIEESEVKIVVGYTKDGICLYQISEAADDEEICVEFDNYFDGSKGAQMLCIYDVEEDEALVTYMQNRYKVSGDTYSGEMTVYMSEYDYYTPDVTVSYKVSAKNKTVLGMPVGSIEIEMGKDMTVSIEAKEGKKGDEHVIGFDIDGIEGEITIVATDKSSVSKPKGKGTTVDADSYEDIVEELSEAVQEVIDDLS